MSNTKSLFSLFQKLDYRDKENSGKKKLTGILIAYLFANSALSYNFFTAFDERSFIILTLTSNIFLIALIVLNDFDNLFLASKSYEVLNMLPVKSREFFLAKFLSAILFLLLFISASMIPQVIFFYFIDRSILKTVFYIFTNIIFCYFTIGVLLFIYISVLTFFKERVTLILNFFQILFFVFIFYSSSLSSKAASKPKGIFIKENILQYGIANYFPQTFFSNSVYDLFSLAVCFIISVSVFIALYYIISGKYYMLIENVNTIKKKKPFSKPKLRFTFISNFIDKLILTNNYEIASFNLVKYQLRNSKFLRLKYFPVLLIPVMFVIVGLISDSNKLLFFNKEVTESSFFKTAVLVLSPSVTLTLLMCSRLLISNTKILDDNSNDTEWIYDSLPVKQKSIIKGANKFIYTILIFPVLAVITVLLSFKADFSTVIYNILFISSGIYFINSVALLFDKTYPFVIENSRFNSASKFIEVFFAMFLGIILFLLQIFVFQNIIFVIITFVFFISASLLLNRN